MARHTIPDIIDRAATAQAIPRPLALSLLASLRPYQWTKNLIVFAALLFGQRLLELRVAAVRDGRLRDLLRAVRRCVSDQRCRGPGRGPAASGEDASADRVRGAARGHRARSCARAGGHGPGRRLLSPAAVRRGRRCLSRAAGALLRSAEAHRHHRRTDDSHRVRAARGGWRGGDQRRRSATGCTS